MVLKYVNPKHYHVAINAAASSWDKEFTMIPAILDMVKSEDVKNELIHFKNNDGQTFLYVAAANSMRKIVSWLVNETIKENNDPMLTEPDLVDNQTPLQALADNNNNYDFIETILNKLDKNEDKLHQLLHKDYKGSTVISRSVNKRDIEAVVEKNIINIFGSMDMINCMEILFPLFKYSCDKKMTNF